MPPEDMIPRDVLLRIFTRFEAVVGTQEGKHRLRQAGWFNLRFVFFLFVVVVVVVLFFVFCVLLFCIWSGEKTLGFAC